MSSTRYELQSYFTNKRYKDGLKKCETCLKKSPSDVTLLLYKARFLRSLTRPSEADAVLDTILSRTTPITDPVAIEQLESYLHEANQAVYPRPLTHGQKLTDIWNKALAAASRNVSALHKERLTSALHDRRWKDASSALQVWRKAAPADRNLKFLHIAVQIMVSEKDPDSRTGALSKMLALKTLETTPPQSANELRTAIKVLARPGAACEDRNALLRVLDDADESLVAVWEFTRVRLETLAAVGDWARLQNESGQLLGIGTDAAAVPSDDWLVWKSYLTACSETSGEFIDTEEVLSRLPRSNLRNHGLATLRLAVLAKEQSTDTRVLEYKLLAAVTVFLDSYKSKLFCFGDVASVLPELSKASRAELLTSMAVMDRANVRPDDEIQLDAWINSKTTLLRIHYFLHETDPPHNPINSLHTLLVSVLKAQQAQNSTNVSTPDLMLLAAEVLIRLYDHTSQPIYLCRAAYILEPMAAARVFQAQVALTYIYQTLSMPSLAMAHYQSLRVRDIQSESFAHSIFTNLSLMHPHDLPLKGQKPYEPYAVLRHVLTRHKEAEHHCFRYTSELAVNERTEMLFEINDLRDTLDKSIVRRILILEQRRIARLTDMKLDRDSMKLEPAAFAHWTEDLRDSRDYSTSFHTAPKSLSTLERRLQSLSGIPDASWVHFALFKDQIWSFLQDDPTPLLPFNVAIPIPEKAGLSLKPELALFDAWIALSMCLATPTNADTLSHLTSLVQGLDISVLESLDISESHPKANSDTAKSGLNGSHEAPNKQIGHGDRASTANDQTYGLSHATTLQNAYARMDFLRAAAKYAASSLSALSSTSASAQAPAPFLLISKSGTDVSPKASAAASSTPGPRLLSKPEKATLQSALRDLAKSAAVQHQTVLAEAKRHRSALDLHGLVRDMLCPVTGSSRGDAGNDADGVLPKAESGIESNANNHDGQPIWAAQWKLLTATDEVALRKWCADAVASANEAWSNVSRTQLL